MIPETAILEQAYRRAAALKYYGTILARADSKVAAYADAVEVPQDLGEQIRKQLAQSPSQSWDDAIGWLLPPMMFDE